MKAVGESMQNPMLYYKNNIIGMINLLEVMKTHSIYNLVFSSSCTVYGEPEELPITEEKRIGQSITNVYGRTKYFIEEILRDVSYSDDKWNIIALRYFNPVGAHVSFSYFPPHSPFHFFFNSCLAWIVHSKLHVLNLQYKF